MVERDWSLRFERSVTVLTRAVGCVARNRGEIVGFRTAVVRKSWRESEVDRSGADRLSRKCVDLAPWGDLGNWRHRRPLAVATIELKSSVPRPRYIELQLPLSSIERFRRSC